MLTEEYVFLPSLRRSLRLSSASRCTPILGTDYLADDTDWKPAFFKPEYYGEKKLLVAVADPKTAYTEQSRPGLFRRRLQARRRVPRLAQARLQPLGSAQDVYHQHEAAAVAG
jgi:hypothetical protein